MIDMLANPVLLSASASGSFLFKPLYWLFGYCMKFLMSILSNQYFLAIVIFTLLTRLIMLPLNVRQQKTVAKTSRLQPKIAKIQKKYPNPNPKERAKMSEEMEALYEREGHNPMSMGCGTMIFQMVFLMGIVGIIYYPLSYIIGMGGIDGVADELYKTVQGLGYEGAYIQLGILENWGEFKDALIAGFPDLFNAANCQSIEAFRSGMYIGSLDMTAIPHWKDGAIVLIPIVSFLTSLGSTIISALIQKKNNPAAGGQMMQMIMMSLMMPLFSLFIAFQVPAAVGFYWIISNVVAILQQVYIAFVHPPRKSQAKLMVENTIERRSREENIKKIK